MSNKKQTSSKVASIASKILKDGRTSKSSKSVAGSALSQTKPKKKKYNFLSTLDIKLFLGNISSVLFYSHHEDLIVQILHVLFHAIMCFLGILYYNIFVF